MNIERDQAHPPQRAIKESFPTRVSMIDVGYDSSAACAAGIALHRLAVWKIEPWGTHDPV